MKTRIITWVITLGALLDTLYGVLAENSGLLSELGVSPKATKVILLIGVLWTAFSRSLVPIPAQKLVNDTPPPPTTPPGDGAGTPPKAP